MRGNVPATMKALVAYSAADYRFEQAFPVPECEKGIHHYLAVHHRPGTDILVDAPRCV